MQDPSTCTSVAYAKAQTAIADLKAAIYCVLLEAVPYGLKNVDIGRALGIYSGHMRHEGHISRTLLAIMENEGVVEQDSDTKSWRLKSIARRSSE